jgi:hypothetical protein
MTNGRGWDNRSKMKKEHFETLDKSIQEVIRNVGIDKVKQFRKEIKFAKNQFISFIWAMFRTATDQDFRSELYTYLNDSNIETALKKILESYEEIK